MNQRLKPAPPLANWSSLRERFAQAFPPQRHARLGVVLAVSGGADSVAMLRLIVELWDSDPCTDRRHLLVAHYNHAARGEHSAADQRFVAELARSLGVDVVSETDWETAALWPGSGSAGNRTEQQRSVQNGDRHRADRAMPSEDSLRQRRYDFLRRTVAARGARYVLTAHTADDQVETLLHHLFRGTGPAGLCGIPASRSIAEDFVLFRPLLGLGRAELRAALLEIGQPWREDHSNDDLDYQRNWIRHELLPQIRSRYPAADQAILRLVHSQSQWHQTLRGQAQRWLDSRVVFLGERVQIERGAIEPAIFGLAMTLIWDRAGWPRQALAAKHYRAIAALVAGDQLAVVTLPDAIRAEAIDEARVLIQRSDQDRKRPPASEIE